MCAQKDGGHAINSSRSGAWRLGAALLILLSGCATGRHATSTGRTDDATQLDIDSERAFVRLTEMEPRLESPEQTGQVADLSSRAARQITKADTLIEQERFTEASLALERALRYDPKHPEIHRTLAALHWKAGNVHRAETHARLTLEAKPDDMTAHYVLGRCAVSRGESADAVLQFRTALLCGDPDDQRHIPGRARYYLAEALADEGYLTAALDAFAAFERQAEARAEEEEGSASWLAAQRIPLADARSRILERLGKFSESAEAIAEILADSPGDAARGVRCASLFSRAGRSDEALRVARTITSDSDEVIALLADIHERAGRPQGIVEDLRARGYRRPGDPRLVIRLAEALDRFDDTEVAYGILETFLVQSPEADAVRMRLIDMLIEGSQWIRAVGQCGEAIRHAPTSTAASEAKVRELAANEGAVDVVLDPDGVLATGDAVGTYLVGLFAAAAGRDDRAETLLRQACALDESFAPPRAALASLYLRAYRYDEALRVAGRGEDDVAQDPRIERILGDVQERLDDLEQAELHYKAAVQLNRDDAEAMLSLASVLRRRGETNRARRQLQILLERQPDHEKAHESLAMLFLQERKSDSAITQLQALRRLSESPATVARCDAMLAHLQSPDSFAFQRALTEAIERTGPDVTTSLMLAENMAEVDPERSSGIYRRVLALEPDNESAMLGLVRCEEQTLRYESAAKLLTTLLPRRPNRHSWRLSVLDLKSRVWDFETVLALARDEEARDDLDDETQTRYRNWIVEALEELERGEEALQNLEAWSTAAPDDRGAALRLAQGYLNDDQPDRAVAICDELYQSDLDNEHNVSALVLALGRAERHERAAQLILDRVWRDPESDAALGDLLVFLTEIEHTDDALEVIDNKLTRTRNREAFQDVAITVLASAERHDEAVERVEALIDEVTSLLRSVSEDGSRAAERPVPDDQLRLRPNAFSLDALHDRLEDLRSRLAGALLGARRYRDAEQSLRGWLDIARDPRVRFNHLMLLAAALQLGGMPDEAADASEQALALRPDHVQLNNDIAYGWIDRGVRLQEAQRMIRHALSRQPGQAAYLDTYGWLMYKKGAFAEAKKWLTRASRALQRDDPVVFDHLGDACWRLGNQEAAIEHWAAAVAVAGEREDDALSPDERRVLTDTQGKIDAARAGDRPRTAALAAPVEEPTE